MNPRRLRWLAAAALATLSALSTQVAAEPPLRLIVPLGAGGPSDLAARSLARALADELGREVQVHNQPGDNGAAGARALQAADADGRTLLFAPLSVAGLPMTQRQPPFASMAELSLLATVGGNRMCLYVHPALQAGTLQDFIAQARSAPPRMGQVSLGEQLVSQQLMRAGGFQVERVAYDSGPKLLVDLVDGKLQAAVLPSSIGVAQAASGALRLLACAAPQRIAALPQVPTMAEAGLDTLQAPAGHVIAAPAGLAAAQAAALVAAIQRAAARPEVRSEFRRLHLDEGAATPEQTLALVRETEAVWRRFVQDAGIAPQ